MASHVGSRDRQVMPPADITLVAQGMSVGCCVFNCLVTANRQRRSCSQFTGHRLISFTCQPRFSVIEEDYLTSQT